MNTSRRRVATILLMIFALVHLVGCDSTLVGPNSQQKSHTEQSQLANKLAELTVPSVTGVEEQPFFVAQQTVFETLFTQSYDPDYWNYTLDQQVTGTGVYPGSNQFGDALDLEVLSFGSLPLEDLNLTPRQMQDAQASGMEFGAAIGWISAGTQKIAVSGSLFSANVPGMGFQSRFMVTALEDPEAAIFTGGPEAPALAQLDGVDLYQPQAAVIIEGHNDCEQDCLDAYNEAVEQAQAAYQDAVNGAQDAYDTAIATAEQKRDTAIDNAQSAFDSTKDSADNWLAAKLVGIHAELISTVAGCTAVGGILSFFTAGAALAICIAAAHVVYAYEVSSAISTHDGTIATAAGIRDGLINTALNAFAIAKQNAQIALNEALQTAQDQLDDAMTDAQQALDDCLNACRRERVYGLHSLESVGNR